MVPLLFLLSLPQFFKNLVDLLSSIVGHSAKCFPDAVKDVCFCSVLVEPEEIKRLGKRFKKLDLDQSGSLSVEEFMSLPELQQNPLVQRVIEIFDQDGNGEVDFKGWLLQYN